MYRCTFRLLRATRIVLHPSRSLNQRFHSRIKIHPLISESYPASLALVRTRIVGFSALKTDEQLRAAALALKRDLGVDTAHIRLATRALNKDDEVAVAFASVDTSPPASALDSATANNPVLSFPAAFFEAMQSDEVRWFGAPNGIAVGPGGSVAIEPHSVSTSTVQNDELPNEIVTLLSARGAPNRVALHDTHDTHDTHDAPSVEKLALWSAATGATFTLANANTFTGADRNRNPNPNPNRIALVAVSQATISKPRNALDRALMVACVASVICLGLATLQWFTDRTQLKHTLSSAPASGTISTPRAAIAGDLFARIATISPELVRSMKSATYGGDAWIVSLNAPVANNASSTTTPTSAVKNSPEPDTRVLVNNAAAALRNNGFSVQATLQPEPRLRVQAP